MSVPTHDFSCRSWTFPVDCWTCNQPIFIFQCTCGSTVLFDSLGVPWPRHHCGGISSSPQGSAAIQRLVRKGGPIDKKVLGYTVDNKKTKRTPLVRVEPSHQETFTLTSVLREVQVGTNALRELKNLGLMGMQMLGLGKNQNLIQATFHDTNDEQQRSFTCFSPKSFKLEESDRGKLYGIKIVGYVIGSLKCWIVRELQEL